MFVLPDLARIATELLEQIPPGKITTYQSLAIALGDKLAARIIPSLIASNTNRADSLSYKIVQSDGTIPAKTEAERTQKIQRLHSENISVVKNQVVPLTKFLFREFQCDAPLKKLQQLQLETREKLSLRAERTFYQTVGGIDLSYAGSMGIAAYVSIELLTKKVLSSHIQAQEVKFPYIPSYLAFRELPAMLALMQKLKSENALAEITLVDGNGTLHHRHAGIACQLGVLLDVATIGITKSLLYGHAEKNLEKLKPGEMCYIEANGQKLGAALRARPETEPFFISPGHKINLESAIEIARACLGNRCLPEPIQLAHEASQTATHPYKSELALKKKISNQKFLTKECARAEQRGLFDKS
jgi:deoxyribonuclease V